MFSVNNFAVNQPFKVDYIKMEPTGMSTSRRGIILISKEKLKVGSSSKWYAPFVTDSNTFAVIARYIKENQQYYTNSEHKNWGDPSDYSITLNGKRYDVYYEMAVDYFLGLIKYLKENNCDKEIIDWGFKM
jgi:hypothetical protein